MHGTLFLIIFLFTRETWCLARINRPEKRGPERSYAGMPVEDVKEYLKRWGKDKDVMEFEESCATVDLAAKAAGVIPARIAKSITLRLGEGCVLVVAAGDGKIDNRKFKNFFGCKAKMLTPDEALAFTGHAVGGVCPFAVSNPSVSIYLDVSLKRFDTVFPACGSSNSVIELSLDELYACSGAAGWADVCGGWEL